MRLAAAAGGWVRRGAQAVRSLVRQRCVADERPGGSGPLWGSAGCCASTGSCRLHLSAVQLQPSRPQPTGMAPQKHMQADALAVELDRGRPNPLQVPFCSTGRFDCLNVRTSDNQIITACVRAAIPRSYFFPLYPALAEHLADLCLSASYFTASKVISTDPSPRKFLPLPVVCTRDLPLLPGSLMLVPTRRGKRLECFHRLWVSALVGMTWLLVFGIFRDKIAVYRTRLVRTCPCL